MTRYLFVSLGIFLLCGTARVFACVCGGMPIPFSQIVINELNRSTAVFAGKVIAMEYRTGIRNEFWESKQKESGRPVFYETLVARFKVERWWKGNMSSEAFIVTEVTRASDGTSSSSTCNFDFDEGGSYLVFARGKENELRTDNCSSTGPFNEHGKVVKILGEGKIPVKSNDTNKGILAPDPTQPIKGWRVPGETNRDRYFIYRDTSVRHEGNTSASLKSIMPGGESAKTALLMQTIRADNHLNRRIRLSVFAKTERVARAGFWMRMDGDDMRVLNTDNMADRPISGTTDWKQYDIVLDVPAGTHQIVIGASLNGGGQIWIDDLRLEEVGLDVAVTSIRTPAEIESGSLRSIEKYKSTNKEDYDKQLKAFLDRDKTAPLAPANLDFEN